MTKIGLEIHCQLTNLESKLFCSCKANYREFGINENICPICMGLPGSLPRLNQEAVKKATMIAMALNCSTPDKIAFFRKNYFYPDLPKNFQITQLNIYGDTSIGGSGSIMVGDKKIRITRIQLEEDPGRLIYEGSSSKNLITLVDYNRAGTPLVEIVTEPDFESPKQVREFINILSDLLENLEVFDPGLEGAMRADANVSIEGGKKVEIKNIGSFHDLEKAVHFEITRQKSLHSRDIEIIQETRNWDDQRKTTTKSRSKEEELDYRYFLEGDIPWIKINPEVKENLEKNMPESISAKQERYLSYDIQKQIAESISKNLHASKLYNECIIKSQEIHGDDEDLNSKLRKEIANIISTHWMSLCDTKEKIAESNIKSHHLVNMSFMIIQDSLSRNKILDLLTEIYSTGQDVTGIIQDKDLGKITDYNLILNYVLEVLKEELEAVEQAKSNPQTINYLVGKVMQKTKGKADPKLTLDLLKKQLK